MTDYRLYRCDSGGKIQSAEWISAADDAASIIAAQALKADVMVEIWERRRLVARLDAAGNRVD